MCSPLSQLPNMGTEITKEDRNTPEYLTQLLKDKKQLQALPNIFTQADKLLDEEINRVRSSLFHHQEKKQLNLPEAIGPAVSLQEKLFVPVREHPEFNFVGRILGPRGMTAKQLEQETGCKIMVRGKGSMRDKAKEDMNRGKPNWEHLSEDLHVLITVEDTRSRAELKLSRAKEEVQKLLVPSPEGEDDLKKKQLMELAILNGTYRDQKPIAMFHPFHPHARFLAQPFPMPVRAPTASPAGAPIILAPRLPPPMTPMTVTSTGVFGGAPPPLISPPGDNPFMFNPYEQHSTPPFSLAATPTILEYPQLDPRGAAGGVPKMRRHTLMGVREHPYSRV